MRIALKLVFVFSLIIFCNILNAQDFFGAIKDGNYEFVEQTIDDEPLLVDSIVQWGMTPLMAASYFGQDTVVELLLKHGADINKVNPKWGLSALHYATFKSRITVIDVLFEHNIDVNIEDTKNKTALVDAITGNKNEVVELLLKHNAKLPEDQELMDICLHSSVLFGFQEMAEQLLANGASLTSIDKYGRSLLHNAIIGNNTQWIAMLLEKNADVNRLDSFSRAPLHYAVDLDQLQNTKTLIQQDAKINLIDCTSRTSLNIAEDLAFVQITELLRSHGGILAEPSVIEIGEGEDAPSEITVTYIANMGVMISSASKTVLIDALFDESYNMMLTPHKNIITKINKLEAPFQSVDLVMITHSDGDHFSAPMVADYLEHNKTVKVVCNNITSASIKDTIDTSIDSTRIVGVTPALCTSTDTLVNDMEVKVMRLRHSGRYGQNENVGFLFEMDGIKIFHSGDAGGDVKKGQEISRIQEYDSIGIEEMNIDVAILNRGSIWGSSKPGIQVVKKHMKPKYIILTHFTENNKQGEWEPVSKTIKENEDELPEITEFIWQMQKVVIQKGSK